MYELGLFYGMPIKVNRAAVLAHVGLSVMLAVIAVLGLDVLVAWAIIGAVIVARGHFLGGNLASMGDTLYMIGLETDGSTLLKY